MLVLFSGIRAGVTEISLRLLVSFSSGNYQKLAFSLNLSDHITCTYLVLHSHPNFISWSQGDGGGGGQGYTKFVSISMSLNRYAYSLSPLLLIPPSLKSLNRLSIFKLNPEPPHIQCLLLVPGRHVCIAIYSSGWW